MLNIIIFFIFLALWILPSFKKQGKNGMPAKKWYWLSALLMAIPGFIVVILLQFAAGWIMARTMTNSILYNFADAFLSAALVEECVKFLAGYLIIKKCGAVRKIDYIFLFGMSGIGYEITESLLGMSGGGVIGGIVRGIFCIHVFWQMFMGAHFYEYQAAKTAGNKSGSKKEFCKTFLLPIFLHGFNDFSIFVMERGVNIESVSSPEITDENMLLIGSLLFIISFVCCIVFIIKTNKMVHREAKKSKELEATAAEAAAPAQD